MDVVVVFVLWTVLGIVFMLPPLVGRETTPLYEQWPWLAEREADEEVESATSETGVAETPASGQPITGGGRRCHNCGTTMDAEYTYCGECLMPRV